MECKQLHTFNVFFRLLAKIMPVQNTSYRGKKNTTGERKEWRALREDNKSREGRAKTQGNKRERQRKRAKVEGKKLQEIGIMERIYNGDKWLLIHSDNKVHFSFGSANANAFISRSSPSERQKLLPRSLLFMHIVFVRNPFSCECGRKNQSEKNNKVERNP